MSLTTKQIGQACGEDRHPECPAAEAIGDTQAAPTERADPPRWEALFGALDAALMVGEV